MFSISYLHLSPEWLSALGSGSLIVLCSFISNAVLFHFAGEPQVEGPFILFMVDVD